MGARLSVDGGPPGAAETAVVVGGACPGAAVGGRTAVGDAAASGALRETQSIKTIDLSGSCDHMDTTHEGVRRAAGTQNIDI